MIVDYPGKTTLPPPAICLTGTPGTTIYDYNPGSCNGIRTGTRAREAIMKPSYDIVIAGGGLSGIAAAAGAARTGASVCVIEQSHTPGGTAVTSLVGPLLTFHSPAGRVIGGFAQSLVERLMAAGASPGHLPDPVGFASSVTPVDPDSLRITLTRILREAGIDLLLGHRFLDINKNGSIAASALFEGTSGELVEISGRFFIDATGNGDLTLAAGAPMEIDKDCQPMTLIFFMDNVDTASIIQYQKTHPDEFYMPQDITVLDRAYTGVSGFFSHVAKARTDGRLSVKRDRLLLYGTTRPGEVLINTTRVTGYSGLSQSDITAATAEALEQIDELVKFVKSSVPGFSNARLTRIAERIGVRETRRLSGRYVMNEYDVAESSRFDDAIAKGAFPMDIHLPDSSGMSFTMLRGTGHYDIPLRSLLNTVTDNVLTVGKCISVTHSGFSSTRVMATCMAVGQAGGVAAALALNSGKDCEDITSAIQSELRSQQAIIFEEDIVTPDHREP